MLVLSASWKKCIKVYVGVICFYSTLEEADNVPYEYIASRSFYNSSEKAVVALATVAKKENKHSSSTRWVV